MTSDTAILWLYFFIVTAVSVGGCLIGLVVFLVVLMCRKKKRDKRGRLIDSDDEDEIAEKELDEYNKSIREGIEMSDLEAGSNKKKKIVKIKNNTSKMLGSRIIGGADLGATRQREELFFESQKKETGSSKIRSRRGVHENTPIAPVTGSEMNDPMAPGSRLPFSNAIRPSEISENGISIVDGKKVRKVKKVIKKIIKKKSSKEN